MTPGDHVDVPNDEIRRRIRAAQREQDRVMPVMAEVLDRMFDDDRITPDQRGDVVLGGLHRRRFLQLGGATILGSAFLAACGSSKKSSSSAPASTTTTAPPATQKDITILRAASSLEEVAVATYQKALDSGLVKTSAVQTAVSTFQGHHKLHSNFFQNATVAAGGQPYKSPNPLLMDQIVTPRLAAVKTEADVIQLAYDLEKLASSTYQADVGTFDDLSFNQKVMSVGAIEARHVAVLAPLLGKPPTPDGAFQSKIGAASANGV